MAIERLFIANRGEIAVRIVRAAKDMGVHTIQAHSEADADMLAVRLADEAVEIGPPPAKKSYLDVERLIAAAKKAGADAVHPGYGFLSESARFAKAVEDAGLTYVGPASDTIERMGDKVAARQAAEAAGVRVVPGSDGRVADIDAAVEIADEIGYPVMVKAAAGGGGKGIRVADDEEALRKLAPRAKAEAEAAFGDGGLYVERAVVDPRHIEVQIMGDGTDAVHLFERECSLQRRRQKVWEEAPAMCLDEATREKLCTSAADLARSVGYRGAGTVEYLFEESTGDFFFIEMNTRIQVEHPVTEMITGVDLIKEMIRVAGGESLSVSQDDIHLNGHAIEVRINAENPEMDFLPSPGEVGEFVLPEQDWSRFDHFLYEGYEIPPFYDSLLGKLIVHAPDREVALERLVDALETLKIGGIQTTVPLHLALAADPEVRSGKFHTRWLESWLADGGLTAQKNGG